VRTSATTADGGESLIEVLIAIALLGIAFAAALGGMRLGLLGSQVQRSHADTETVLLRAVEQVKAGAYVPCATGGAADYLPGAQSALPAGWAAGAVTIPSIDYWDGNDFDGNDCAANEQVAPILRIQRITVQVSDPTGGATASMTFVKRA
jgi:type II secretory pathway pseudopilin PulG